MKLKSHQAPPQSHGQAQPVTTGINSAAPPSTATGFAELRRKALIDLRTVRQKGDFDALAIRDMTSEPSLIGSPKRRVLRRPDLRLLVPLADSTIYELERQGQFPKRFWLTPRCVVWDLDEVDAWLESRKRPTEQSKIAKAPAPDYRLRRSVRSRSPSPTQRSTATPVRPEPVSPATRL